MRRSRAVDWWLLGTLLPLYAVMQGVGIHANLATGASILPFRLSGAEGSDGYPLVRQLRAPRTEIQVGDRLLRLGDHDLRGLSLAQIFYRTRSLLGLGRPFDVEVERGAVHFTTRAEPLQNPSWWWALSPYAALAGVASFLLLRAPHWHLARHFFVLSVAWACFGASFGPSPPLQRLLGAVIAIALAQGLTLWFFLSWAPTPKPGRSLRALAWGIGVASAGSQAAYWLFPTGAAADVANSALAVLFIALALAALARAYRRSEPVERRKLRWILYAHFVGMLPIVLMIVHRQLAPQFDEGLYSLAWVFVAAIPLGYAVAIVGYHWLDIDRVISASAAATLVGVALVGGVLVVVPPLAQTASMALGVDPETGRLALSMALAAVLVPAYRGLRPWLDRRLFAERHELAQRFERLRAELGASRSVDEIATRAGVGFDALLHPESIAIYGRAGDAFTPLFVRGRAAPPAFAASSMLVQVLEAKRAPLFAHAQEIEPFERAALETLGAEVVVPQLREEQLVAFTCLAAKRSGDIYTASDLALLHSVAERCGEVIARLDLETLAKEAQAMQLALRRYVPAAVAERVIAGDSMKPAEREVTVLFVDIRGYTGVAERLAAEDVFATLNEHTERVSRIVQENSGTIVEFNGDGMMAVFGAPEALAKKEQSAVEAARRIVDSMPPHLGVGVGVATGPAFVGNIRSSDRLIWSAVGSTTNLAARLQGMTRDLGASIAIDETTRERAGYVCTDFVRHEGVAIRGRMGRFDVFALQLASG